MSAANRARFIRVRGVVQGVGFRPFVYGLATALGLAGWVRNTSSGVEIALEGPRQALERFGRDLVAEAPPRAHIEEVAVEEASPNGYRGFEIRESRPESGSYQLVSPDIAICEDCRRELFAPADRRYRYPFTNCTNCGPRFTIIKDIPYDRPLTTMAAFRMCPECQAEYEDPRNRRFHAQPNACPACGPHVSLVAPGGRALAEREEAIRAARQALAAGQVLAVKGLGGFHLACDATSEAAIATLRRRKIRPAKPLAIMVPDLEAARRLAFVSPAEAALLTSPERPIVLLNARRMPSAHGPTASPSAVGIEGAHPSQDRGSSVPASSTSPLLLSGRKTSDVAPPPSPRGRGDGGEGLSADTPGSTATSPLPRSGRGAGGEGLAADTPGSSATSPLPRSGRGAGGEGLSADTPRSSATSPLPRSGRGAGGEGSLAPGTDTIGVMLPYTPLHYLLLEPGPGFPPALVMTSGNLSEEPIAMDNDEALARLGGIADLFLLHNRDIYARYDDSVWFVPATGPQPARRARGYAPFPVKLPCRGPQVLACGPELKNTFCFTRDGYAFLSPHIGDLENVETLDHYERSVELYRQLFRLEPHIVAYDLHPEYLASKYARQRWGADPAVALVGVQHHHAHIAACLADNGRAGPAIGVALDGTGYGSDGRIWGGEFLLADLRGFRRVGHLREFPLPGGTAAIRRPCRTALGLLLAAGQDPAAWPGLLEQLRPQEAEAIRRQVEQGLNAPLTTSAGRLFDAVAALVGLRGEVSYEAQAAMELEALAAGAPAGEPPYPFALEPEGGAWVLDWRPLLAALRRDLAAGLPRARLAARFHAGVARAIVEMVGHIARESDLYTVALSGGCFQNRLLLEQTARDLAVAGFEALVHRQVPANDGGVALGQAVVAAVGQGT